MGSIFSSHRALAALAALEQAPDGLRLTDLARAIGAPVSSAQVSIGALEEDGFVGSTKDRPPRYVVRADQSGDVAKLIEVVATRDTGADILAAALRANRAVEFASRDDGGVLVVLRWDAEPSDEVALNRMFARFDLEVTRLGHDEVRERVRDDPKIRERALRARIIRGSAEQSFPDPFRHGSGDAPLLGHLHPTLMTPSRRALSRIAQRFGLAEIRVFGSAVHADFRPDSDIDVAVRRVPGRRRTLDDEFSLRRELEGVFGRDVDVVDERLLREPIWRKATREGVVLYG